jgi:predicted ATPase
VACLAFGAVAEWLLGETEGALDRSRAAVRLAREGSQPSTLALALCFAAMLHQFRDDPAGVRECAGEALDVSVEHRFAFWQAGATVLLGWATAAGGTADGVGQIEQGLTAWQATGSETYRAYYLGLLADARGRCDRTDAALAALDESERVAAAAQERLFEPEVHRLRGDFLAGRSPREAEAAYRRAVASARSQGARSLEARAAAGLARLMQAGG